MVLLPIVERELAIASRKSSTYWLRTGTACLGLVLFTTLYLASNGASDGGHIILRLMAYILLGVSLLYGVFLTSDCLASEKREGTLGLLFLTDLKPHDIILGKLAASSLTAFFSLLAVFPILGLPLLAGGVSGVVFSRILLVLLASVFLSLSVGLLVSSITQESATAITGTFLLILLPTAGTLMLWWLTPFHLSIYDHLVLGNPFYACQAALLGQGFYFWPSLLSIMGIAFAAIIAAHFFLARSLRQKSVSEIKKQVNPKTLSQGPGENQNPGCWLAIRDFASGRLVGVILFLGIGIWLALMIACFNSSANGNDRGMYFVSAFFAAYILHVAFKFALIVEASRRSIRDRKSGALELLLATPIQVETFLAGIQQGFRKKFLRAAIYLTLVNGGLIATIILAKNFLKMDTEAQIVFFQIFSVGILLLWIDLYAAPRVAFWHGVACAKHHVAILRTVAWLFGPTWLFVGIAILARFGSGVSSATMMVIIAIWTALGAFVGLLKGIQAHYASVDKLRCILAEANR